MNNDDDDDDFCRLKKKNNQLDKSILLPVDVVSNCQMNGKQRRPWSDIAFSGHRMRRLISVYTWFAQVCLFQLMNFRDNSGFYVGSVWCGTGPTR